MHAALISFGATAAAVLIAWLWRPAMSSLDLALLVSLYAGTVLGITLGFHRLGSHQSFRPRPFVRIGLWALGSMAAQGPLIYWVTNHRRHHRYSDHAGDPHSPHIDHSDRPLASWRGWYHAHVGWIFHASVGDPLVYARDLYRDPWARWFNRTYLVWPGIGLLCPWLVGWWAAGTLEGSMSALYWGGIVRLALSFNLTGAINSLSHMWGPRPFDTGDESRNLWILALPTFGDAWHNNHHAFPWSARHGLYPHQLDLGWLLLRGLARLGWVHDLKTPTPRDYSRFAARANHGNRDDSNAQY